MSEVGDRRVPDRRRKNRDPEYVNRAIQEGRPDVTTDSSGHGVRVVPAEPPWNQTGDDDVDTELDGQVDEDGKDTASPDASADAAGSGNTGGGDGDGGVHPPVITEAQATAMRKADLVTYATGHGVDSAGTQAELMARLRAAGKVLS